MPLFSGEFVLEYFYLVYLILLIEYLLFQILLISLSIFANFLSAISGGGAGLIQFPFLIFLGLPFSVALATHKLASVSLGIGASLRHLQEGSLKPSFMIFIFLFGIPGVFIGSNFVPSIPDQLAYMALGILTFCIGLYSLANKRLSISNNSKSIKTRSYLVGGFVLFLIGVLNGSLSSGTGLLVTIWLVSWFGLSYSEAIGYTLIIVGFFWNGLGALVLAVISTIRWDWLPSLILGSLIGGYLGAHVSIKSGNKFVKKMFEFICMMMGFSLILRSFF